MTIMHLFSIADGNHHTPNFQFRDHHNIPWDEAFDYYLNPGNLKALIKLARAAQGGDESSGLKGRVFDVLRAVSITTPSSSYQARDSGPYAIVTDSSVWTRIELEAYLLRLTEQEWDAAKNFGLHLRSLLQKI